MTPKVLLAVPTPSKGNAPEAFQVFAVPGIDDATVSWTASQYAATYTVNYRLTGASPWTQWASGVTSLSALITGLTPGVSYDFEVEAVNNVSTTVSAVVSCIPLRGTPASVQSLSVSAGDSQATLSWIGASGATSYNILQGTSSGQEQLIAFGVTALSYMAQGLANGTTYYWQVQPVNVWGPGPVGSEVSATPAAATVPAAPSQIDAFPTSPTVIGIKASTVSGATSYKCYRGSATATGSGPYIWGPFNTLVGTSATPSFSDTSIANGNSQSYVVTALNGAAESVQPLPVNAMPTASGAGTELFNAIAVTPAIVGSATCVKATGAGPFGDDAWHITTPAAGAAASTNQVRWPSIAPIANGDYVQVRFWFKSASPASPSAEPIVQIKMGETANDSNNIIDRKPFYEPLGQWRLIQMGLSSNTSFEAFATGAIDFCLYLGLNAQDFMISNIQVMDMGKTWQSFYYAWSFEYPGSYPTASWRAANAAKITAARTGQLTVQVRDVGGAPIPNHTVTIKQIRNAFNFGSAVTETIGAYTPAQTGFLLCGFNHAGEENALKWAQFLNPPNAWTNFEGANDSSASPKNPHVLSDLQWLLESSKSGVTYPQSNYVLIRGHNLVWPTIGYVANSFYRLPPIITSSSTAAQINAYIATHFANMLANDPILLNLIEWDVLNEPYTCADLQGYVPGGGKPTTPGVLGNIAAANWYSAFKSAAPGMKAWLNDFGVWEDLGVGPQSIYDQTLIKYIRTNGGTVDAMGLESHFGHSSPSMPQLSTALTTWGQIAGEVGITEFDVATFDPARVSQFLIDACAVAYGNSYCSKFMTWGYFALTMNVNTSAMVDSTGGTLTPIGQAFTQQLQGWMTGWDGSVKVTSDALGNATFQGHCGNYQLIAGATTQTATLTTAGTTATVVPS